MWAIGVDLRKRVPSSEVSSLRAQRNGTLTANQEIDQRTFQATPMPCIPMIGLACRIGSELGKMRDGRVLGVDLRKPVPSCEVSSLRAQRNGALTANRGTNRRTFQPIQMALIPVNGLAGRIGSELGKMRNGRVLGVDLRKPVPSCEVSSLRAQRNGALTANKEIDQGDIPSNPKAGY